MMKLVKHAVIVAVAFLSLGVGAGQAQLGLTKAAWDSSFETRFGRGHDIEIDKLLAQDGYDDSQARLAWHGNYWVRAFVSMAETSGDTAYLDSAVTLIDYMLYYRDDARVARGDIDLMKEPYYDAPPHYLMNRNKAVPGWRHKIGDRQWRILTLDDGQITNGIMRFVRLVYGKPQFSAYQAKAQTYLDRVIETVEAHNENYIFDRYFRIPGSYYYPNRNQVGGHYSNPAPYNQSATMGITLILLDEVLGGGTRYTAMARGLVQYWLNYAKRGPNDTYIWAYDPNGVARDGAAEDIGHAHVDVGFLYLAHKYGLGLSTEQMNRLARTWVWNVYLGDSEFAANVDGTGLSIERWNTGLDWIDLAEFDPAILDIASETFNKHFLRPPWSRPYLGWAELLRWQADLKAAESRGESQMRQSMRPDESSPQIAISHPSHDDILTPSSSVDIIVNATDNVAISHVEIYLGEQLQKVLQKSESYRFEWSVPEGQTASYRITAKAYDYAGNSAVDQISVGTQLTEATQDQSQEQ